jgi:hypothetical protein
MVVECSWLLYGGEGFSIRAESAGEFPTACALRHVVVAGLSFYCAFKTYRHRNNPDAARIVPATKAARMGYYCLLGVLPLILYAALNRLAGNTIDDRSPLWAVLSDLALFGLLFGCGLLVTEVLRSAWRPK